MIQTIKKKVTVQTDGLIEIRMPELKSGEQAEVIIMIPGTQQAKISTLKSIIGKGKGCFASPQQADSFIRKERDAWE